MLVDYHLHTTHSIDGHGTVRDVCRQALAVGLREIAITDHLDSNLSDEGVGYFHPDRYINDLRLMQAEFADRLTVRMGVEIGEPHQYRRIVESLNVWPFDVVIGSVHYIGTRGVHAALFDEVPLQEALEGYFDLELQIASCGLVDVLGHLDYFQRYTLQRNMPPFDPRPWEKTIRSILQAVIDNDLALEVNTSGVRQRPGVCFPDRAVLTWYYGMGGRAVTVGSDAHYVEHVGANLTDAVRLLREIGFDSLSVFEQRHRRSMPLPTV